MKPALDPQAKLKREIRRVAGENLAAAQADLRAQGDALHAGIHAARKRFKRVRGLLRLVRAADPETCRSENDRLRTIAQSLSVAREAAALVETLDRLIDRFPGPASLPALQRIRDRLETRRDRITGAEADLSQKIETAIAGCEASASVLAGMHLPSGRKKGARLVSSGFARNYARAREALAAAKSGDAEEPWHTLRKRIRDQWSHSIVLAAAWPGAFHARIAMLKSLIDLLGDDHDLIVLSHMIGTRPDDIGDEDDIAVLRGCVAEQSAELRAATLKTASGLLAETPDMVERRIRYLWRLAADGR